MSFRALLGDIDYLSLDVFITINFKAFLRNLQIQCPIHFTELKKIMPK